MHTDFTPVASTLGGMIIGLAAALLLAFNGRIAGISGILGGFLEAGEGWSWRGLFLLGMILGGLGLTAGDERRYTLSVLTAVLGGGMSSRLFQEVREKRGLAYAVYCFASSHADAGVFGLYAGC
ncbi:MAG TPA: insulinase family protein, partial [Enhygromyxa sp.]|nr:insulinase family protein [Enhygromyxa sp.]